MTNFDFLKNFNDELYEIGTKLEEDVINSPRAVTADATLFLETLVKDIYKLSKKRLDKNIISFYKKTDNLYRSRVITYIYKNKLQEAYNLRNKIHKKYLNTEEEKELAFDLHKRLFYIAKKYFRDYCENERYINIPDYKKPSNAEVSFENCIICGNSNKKSLSNMCKSCNQKVENANVMLTIQNKFKDMPFTRQDLMEYGIAESKAILFLMDLSQFGAVKNKGEYYILNPKNFNNYLAEIDQYIQIGLLITRFYKNEITPGEIINTKEYEKGSENEYPFREFYKLVNNKIETLFEENLLKFRDIKRSMKLSSISDKNIKKWYYHQKELFNEGIINDSFILYNELRINEFFSLKKKNLEDDETILKQLHISDEMYYFWQNQFMGGNFFKKSRKIQKNMILREIKKKKSLNEILYSAGVNKNDFEKMYLISKQKNDDFYKQFNRDYTHKRQKLLIKHLRKNNLNKAIKLCKITKSEFEKWYYQGESEYSHFYVKTTELLMDKYLNYRKNNWNKNEILKEINVSKKMFNSWTEHEEFYLFRQFENKNEEITSTLIKRGLVINGIKEGKGKEEAIFSANLTPREFVDIYNTSKKEHTEFYLRFDYEYEKSRKKRFIEKIPTTDFYNAIQECEIKQSEFRRWYSKDQDEFLSTNRPTSFYLVSTNELMDKYLQARLDGKNKPDAAKSVGLSNTTINKWLNHPEYELFYEFKRKNKQLTIDLIVRGFNDEKSKMEVSEIYDIPLKTIDEFIEFGRNGFEIYDELFDLYENKVIPVHLKIFLNNFKTKSYYNSLKMAKLGKEEINYYYNLGKFGNDKFKDFYEEFIDVKIELYVKTIMTKKSQKIALKNSSLTKEEYTDHKDKIDDMIFNRRIELINDGINKRKNSGVKLAKLIGISVDEIYSWYFEGKNGNNKYEEFAMIFELGVILPRIMAFNKAANLGVPEKWLHKQIKKELGSKDYQIWVKNGIFSFKDSDFLTTDGDGIDETKMLNILKNSDFINVTTVKSGNNSIESVKKSFRDKSKSKSIISVTTIEKSELQ